MFQKSKKLDDMQSISKAGYGLLKFVVAVLGYCEVFKDVKPKIDKVNQLQREFDAAMKVLNKLNREIAKLEEELRLLNEKYEEAALQLAQLTEEAEIMQRRLQAAATLISGLASERDRWTDDLANLHIERQQLIGNCMLSSAFLSYTGPFNFEFRRTMIYDDWQNDIMEREIPLSQPYRIEQNLTNDVEVSKYDSSL